MSKIFSRIQLIIWKKFIFLECHVLGCEPNELECDNTRCVSKAWVCDGFDDCGDGSDELCANVPKNKTCEYNEFACKGGDQCVPRSYQCDNEIDCIDTSDEIGCGNPTPVSYINIELGETFNIACENIGISDIIWTFNRGNVPSSCTSKSYSGFGVLTCRSAEPYHQGAYSCVEINSLGAVFAGHDAVVQMTTLEKPVPYEGDKINLKTYPNDQDIEQNREVVFQCRDEGKTRKAVRWVRGGGRLLPPGSSDISGRLTMPNIQLEHAGAYYCEALDVPRGMLGSRKQVTLYIFPLCRSGEFQCKCDSKCIDSRRRCDGVCDCADASDEQNCPDEQAESTPATYGPFKVYTFTGNVKNSAYFNRKDFCEGRAYTEETFRHFEKC